jgi:hypothetical protein
MKSLGRVGVEVPELEDRTLGAPRGDPADFALAGDAEGSGTGSGGGTGGTSSSRTLACAVADALAAEIVVAALCRTAARSLSASFP